MRRSRVALGALLLLVLIAIVFHSTVLGALGSYLVRDEPPRKSDVIFVLAGDGNGNRIMKAAELVRQGYAPVAIVSGPEIYGVHECDLAIAMAERAGYPASEFAAFPHNGTSTKEEAALAKAEFARRGVKRVILLTSDFHTRRAGKLFRALMPDIDFDVVSALDQHFSPRGWWHDREGEKTFTLEWTKTITEWFGL